MSVLTNINDIMLKHAEIKFSIKKRNYILRVAGIVDTFLLPGLSVVDERYLLKGKQRERRYGRKGEGDNVI